MDVRRVVTGHDADGKAVFVSDEQVSPVVPALLPGNRFHLLWGGDEAPRFPDSGAEPEHRLYFPPVGGFRFGLFTIPPDGGAGAPPDLDIEAALAEFEEKLPGLAGHMEGDAQSRRHRRAERHAPSLVECGERTRSARGVHLRCAPRQGRAHHLITGRR
jgi:hypothetical protein